MELIPRLYIIEHEDGSLMRSGRNHTIAIFDRLGSAQAQVTRYGGRILVLTNYKELEKPNENTI